jgi:hypothetical protein
MEISMVWTGHEAGWFFFSFSRATTKMQEKGNSIDTHHSKRLRGESKVRRCIRERRCKKSKRRLIRDALQCPTHDSFCFYCTCVRGRSDQATRGERRGDGHEKSHGCGSRGSALMAGYPAAERGKIKVRDERIQEFRPFGGRTGGCESANSQGDGRYGKTYSPSTGSTGDQTTRNHHGSDTLCTLEEHTAQCTSNNAVGSIVLTAVVADERVEAVVDHGNDSS